jgi:hypothetical protein
MLQEPHTGKSWIVLLINFLCISKYTSQSSVITRFTLNKNGQEWKIQSAEEIWSVAEIVNASILPGGFFLKFLRPLIGYIITSLVKKVGNNEWKDD